MEKIISFIVIVVILVIIILYNIIIKKNKKEMIDMAKIYLEELSDDFIDIISNVLDNIDSSQYVDIDDIEEFSNQALLIIYDKSWEFVKDYSEKIPEDKHIYKFLFEIITRDIVEDVVSKLFEKDDIQTKIKLIMTDNARKIIKEIEEEEKKAEKEAEKYEEVSEDDLSDEYNGEYDVSEFEAGRMSMVEPEYPDNESPYKEKDETMELISEDIQETPINEELEHIISSTSEE